MPLPTPRSAALAVVLLAAFPATAGALVNDGKRQGANPKYSEAVLAYGKISDRAAGLYRDATNVSCKRTKRSRYIHSCRFLYATIDGDVIWRGTATVTSSNFRANSYRLRYSARGVATSCQPGNPSPPCSRDAFRWTGSETQRFPDPH